MRFSTTSLLAEHPGSLNSPGSKATFYVFHSAPEYLAIAILISLDARRVFTTRLVHWGDRRVRDPEPAAKPERCRPAKRAVRFFAVSDPCGASSYLQD